VRLDEAIERVTKVARLGRCRQFVYQICGGREERIEAVLKRTIGDRDGKVSLAAARLALEDGRTTLSDEVRRQQRADRGQSKRRLVAEVKLFDGTQEGEMRRPHCALQTRGSSMRDFLSEQRLKQLLIAPLLLLRACHELTPCAASVGEM
jgi:hypothetical protein